MNPVPTGIGGWRMMLRVIPMMLRNKAETKPRELLGPFRTNLSAWEQESETGLRVTWFGHSSMLIEVDGARLLVDPVWDQRASPVEWAGPKRFFAPTCRLDELPRVDAILISHDHYDHLGAGTVRQLAKQWPWVRWVTSAGVGKILQGFGVREERITELDWTEATVVAGVTITAVPARHFSGRYAWNRFETLWSSFVLRGPEHNVYCGADSGMWDGFSEIGRQFGPFDLAMIEIGAYNELWHQIHLGPDGGVEAFRHLNANRMMPVHWGLFDLALHDWRQPIERVRELGVPLFQPQPGQVTEVGDVVSDWWKKDPA